MGGTTFTETAYGVNVREVFNNLHAEATYHYGTDSYNGTISTTSLGREIDLERYPELKKALAKNDWKVIEEYDTTLYPEKRNTNYTKKISHYQAFAPKWVDKKQEVPRKKGARMIKKYSVLTKEQFDRNSISFKEFDSLSDAKKAAKELSLREAKDVVVFQYRQDEKMKKEKIQLGLMKLESDGKQYKSKRASKTKVYLPIYEFTFFVFAAM